MDIETDNEIDSDMDNEMDIETDNEMDIEKLSYLCKKLIYKEWDFYVPDYKKKYKINCFDDGREKYKSYPNKWMIFGKWRGKTALVNAVFNNIIIDSISTWKIELINQRALPRPSMQILK